jgi:hypothetical protein
MAASAATSASAVAAATCASNSSCSTIAGAVSIAAAAAEAATAAALLSVLGMDAARLKIPRSYLQDSRILCTKIVYVTMTAAEEAAEAAPDSPLAPALTQASGFSCCIQLFFYAFIQRLRICQECEVQPEHRGAGRLPSLSSCCQRLRIAE